MQNRRDAIKIFGANIIGFGGIMLGTPNIAKATENNLLKKNEIKKIDSYLDKARIDWRAPALAVAIIRNGETIYSKGFGIADVNTQKKCNADTMFGIGSTTKAFTSAAIANLVDKKILSWDAPITEYLPSFKLGHGDDYSSTNLRDMMSHRTGLARHELLWYNNKNLTHEKLLKALPYLETFAPLRAKYQYNNLMVMLAGHAIEVKTGLSWDEFVKNNIFQPLEMTRTNSDLKFMEIDENSARGHRLNDKKTAYAIPLRPEDKIGPAGAINSSVNDFANWVKLQLNKGEFNGTRIFSQKQSNEMWEPLISTGGIPASPELSRGFYGLGWRMDNYRGMLRVAHGGNLNGFASRVTLFPEKNMGIVAFTNLGASPLPGHVSLDLIDMLLGLEPANWSARNLIKRDNAKPVENIVPPRVLNTKPSHNLSEYVGVFNHKGYGDIIVKSENDTLFASYNDMPIKLEHWHYDIFNAINERSEDFDLRDLKFIFNTNAEGKINSISINLDENISIINFIRV